ncbi:MAG: ABC transporter substrate-binding protein [Chloroflexi bacterium]|nr:ABC transporter substrate-binding protein [Chloroflexota bacterium]
MNVRREPYLLLGAAVVLLISLAGCGFDVVKAPEPALKIGLLAGLSGATAEIGTEVRRGAELAIRDLNRRGGVDGRRLELVVEDDEGDPDKGSELTRKLVTEDKVFAIVGSTDPGVTLASMEVAWESRTVQMSPTDTPDKLTQVGNPYFFRLGTRDSDIARLLTRYAARKYQNIGIIHDSSTWGKDGMKAVARELKAVGKPAVSVQSHPRRALDLSLQVAKSQKAGAEAVIVWATGRDAAAIVKQMRRAGFTAAVVGGPGLAMKSFPILARELAESAVLTDSLDPDKPVAKSFIEMYESTYSEPLSIDWAPKAYDSVMVLVDGLRRAGGSRSGLRDALETVSNYEGVCGRRNARIGFAADKHTGLGIDALLLKTWRDGGAVKIRP